MAGKYTKKFSDNFKYESLTTKGFFHAGFCFAAEIMTYRLAGYDKYKLPEYFWRKNVECDEKYKKHYSECIELCRKLMKSAPEHFVIQCLTYTNNLNMSNYGYVTAVIKNKWERWQERAATRISGMIDQQSRKNAISEEIQLFAEEITEEEIKVKSGRKRSVRF